MFVPKKIKEKDFGDADAKDAFSAGDPGIDEIDWDEVQKLQDLIDELPESGDGRKAAAIRLQKQLNEGS